MAFFCGLILKWGLLIVQDALWWLWKISIFPGKLELKLVRCGNDAVKKGIILLLFWCGMKKPKWSLDIQPPLLYLSLVPLKTLLPMIGDRVKMTHWDFVLCFVWKIVMFSSSGGVFTALSLMLISLCTGQSRRNVFLPHRSE